MKKTTQPASADFAQVRKPAWQLLSRDGQAVVRNLEFYREVEVQLLAKRSPCGCGGMRLSPCWAER